ncbi:hypothetical protein M9H77_03379 [Catharanthus roseus]|uniref:Uncharacterized protein n=1 Tax=Catharanthus roseus TaxID=4058 RepID=A0ACC0CBJ2_CATRO|nr:hypothetical protein M9H77_03379 [Catharanthus roseus]
MEAFRFLEFDPCPNITKAYEGYIWAAVQSEPVEELIKKDPSSPHTMEMSRRRPSTGTIEISEILHPPTNVGDFHIKVPISGSTQSGRDMTYYIKYMENLTKSQPTKEAVIPPQEILDALNKYFLSSNFSDTVEEQQELLDAKFIYILGDINVVTEKLPKPQSAFHDIKAERENELDNISKQGRQIAELIKEFKEAKVSSDQSSSHVRELTDVCTRVAQETQLYKIKFDELSIGKSCLIDDKEAAQEMYEDVIAGWAELRKQARDVLGDAVIAYTSSNVAEQADSQNPSQMLSEHNSQTSNPPIYE